MSKTSHGPDTLPKNTQRRQERMKMGNKWDFLTMEVHETFHKEQQPETATEQPENATGVDKSQDKRLEESSNNEPDQNISTTESQSQGNADEIREAFNLFDKDGNGCITLSELRHFLTSLGYNMTEAELMDVMNKIDADGNGAIDFPEFLELTSKKLHVSSDEELARETFQVFDRAQKGHITAGDLRHILKVLEQRFDDLEIQDMIQQADFDHDGVVSFEDFLKMMNIKSPNS